MLAASSPPTQVALTYRCRALLPATWRLTHPSTWPAAQPTRSPLPPSHSADLLNDMLHCFTQLPRSLPVLQELLHACLRTCTDRAAAADVLSLLRQQWQLPAGQPGAGLAPAGDSHAGSAQQPEVHLTPEQASAYACHWSLLLTLDQLAEIRDAELALMQITADVAGDASRPGAAALLAPAGGSQAEGRPLSTLWDHIEPQLHPQPEPASSQQRGAGSLHTGSAVPQGSPAKALLFCNLEAQLQPRPAAGTG